MKFNQISKIFLSFFIIFLFSTCLSRKRLIKKPHAKPGLNSDYLIQIEKIFLSSFGDEEDKENSIEALTERCADSSLNDPHSCYNLSVLYLNFNKKEEAYTHISKAVERSPDDQLYKSMYRNLAVDLEKIDSFNSDNFTKEFTKLEIACSKKEEDKAISIIEPMLIDGSLSKNLLLNGSLSKCFSDKNKNKILKIAKYSSINYSEMYYKQKVNSDPYSNFWDSEYYYKNKKLEDFNPKEKLTLIWKEFRIAVKRSDKSKAKLKLKEFLGEIKSNSTVNKIGKTRATALERAAFLLIEQDKFFRGVRDLTKEF